MSHESGTVPDSVPGSVPEADGHGTSPANIAIGVVIGRSAEFFDFFVYAIASVLVFPRTLFPFLPPVEAMLWSFAIFALGFVSRPFGTMIFSAIDQRWGRGVKLTLALFLLGCATAGIAFTPDYSLAGVYAILILAVMRIAQGIAFGGAWDGLASLLAMNAPENERGWYAMIPQLGAPIGLFVASGVNAPIRMLTPSTRTVSPIGVGWSARLSNWASYSGVTTMRRRAKRATTLMAKATKNG